MPGRTGCPPKERRLMRISPSTSWRSTGAPERPMALPASMPALELRRYPLWQKTGGEADATSWHKGMLPREEGPHRSPEGREDAGRTGLGGAQLRSPSTRQALGRRHHLLCAHLVGVAVSGFRTGRFLPEGGGLVNGDTPAYGVGGRRPEHGPLAQRTAARTHPPLRSRQPVHLGGARQASQGGGAPSLDGFDLRRLRQRFGRVVRSELEDGVVVQTFLAYQGVCTSGYLRVHRDVLQPEKEEALSVGVSQPDRV